MPAPDQFWEFLGSTSSDAGVTSIGPLTIALRRLLHIEFVFVMGADAPAFQFNGDTGTNYWSRYLSSGAGGAAWGNNQNTSQTLARLGVAHASGATMVGQIVISNQGSGAKVARVNSQYSTASAATAANIMLGGFEWVSSGNAITEILALTAAGTTFNGGFMVWGRDF